MGSAREGKYGEITASKKEFHDGEPVFLLRATDPLAPGIVELYAATCRTAGCSAEHVEAAERHAARLRQWQRDNPLLVKHLPD